MANASNKRENIPLHQEVETELRRRIIAGEILPGQKMSPELELAEEFNVSRTTIRHALISLESHGYVERIHGRGTFVADQAPEENPLPGKERGIYAIVPHLTSGFTGTIITGAQEVLFSTGHDLSVLPTNDSIDKEIDYLQMILTRGAAGVILHPTKSEFYNPLVIELINKGIPLVMTGRHYRFVNCSYVDGHNYQGAYDATKYLIGLGHRKIGLVTKKPLIHTSLEDRIQGYRDAMADHSLALDRKTLLLDLKDSRSVYWESGNEQQEQGIIKHLVDYLEGAPKMTAILALNDMIAADLIKAAKHCGKTVGQDLSIVGFDNVALSASLEPPLTTVDSPTLDMGRRATKVLLQHITSEDADFVKEHLPMRLVIRKSCVQR